MKKLIFLVVLSISILSCQKDQSLLIKDVPNWLKNNISGLEKQIKSDPITIAAYTAWVRYEWENEYYFEYFNFSSSTKTGPTCMDGQVLSMADPKYAKYENEKCCMEYVWKGPKF
jgi:hypothetical protein